MTSEPPFQRGFGALPPEEFEDEMGKTAEEILAARSESPGQRCVRECEHVDQFGDLPEVPGACAACIDALVKRERSAALREAADEWERRGLHTAVIDAWLRARAAEESE